MQSALCRLHYVLGASISVSIRGNEAAMATWHADFLLGDWLISPNLNKVSKDGHSVSVKHKSMAVIVFLADAKGEVVTRNEIMDGVWPGMEVTDDVLTQSIVELRKAFADDAKKPLIIETIPRVGFRVIASIRPAESDAPSAAKPNRRHAIAAFVLLISGAILWTNLERDSIERDPIITVRDSSSIAVLPFINMSDDPDNEYFSEGMSDEIRNLLGQIPDLRVIGRTSSPLCSCMLVRPPGAGNRRKTLRRMSCFSRRGTRLTGWTFKWLRLY